MYSRPGSIPVPASLVHLFWASAVRRRILKVGLDKIV
jgi:hypothetical protein